MDTDFVIFFPTTAERASCKGQSTYVALQPVVDFPITFVLVVTPSVTVVSLPCFSGPERLGCTRSPFPYPVPVVLTDCMWSLRQCPLLALLVHGPQMVWECVCVCVCVCVCGRNELEVCTTLAYPHISSFRTILVFTHKHTRSRILKPFEDSEPTGLKVDIARTSLCYAAQRGDVIAANADGKDRTDL